MCATDSSLKGKQQGEDGVSKVDVRLHLAHHLTRACYQLQGTVPRITARRGTVALGQHPLPVYIYQPTTVASLVRQAIYRIPSLALLQQPAINQQQKRTHTKYISTAGKPAHKDEIRNVFQAISSRYRVWPMIIPRYTTADPIENHCVLRNSLWRVPSQVRQCFSFVCAYLIEISPLATNSSKC